MKRIFVTAGILAPVLLLVMGCQKKATEVTATPQPPTAPVANATTASPVAAPPAEGTNGMKATIPTFQRNPNPFPAK